MRKQRIFLVVLAVVTMMFFMTASPVFAQSTEQCSCFCATDNGAIKVSEEKMTRDACKQTCDKQDDPVAVCATSLREYPSNSALCFDEATCTGEKYKGVTAKKQSPFCPTGWNYCYPSASQVTLTLSTKIGNLETVGDLGTYVQAVYSWMINGAFLFAVVMMMVGGLQYALGAASKEQVTKAKKRIKDGIIGLVLLLCAVLIVQTVNPQLLKLQIPRPSLLRDVNLDDMTCEKYLEDGYTLAQVEGKEECGGMAEIKLKPDGTPEVDGKTCHYGKCDQGTCVPTRENPGGMCILCRDVSLNNPSTPVSPSSEMCSKLGIIKPDVVATWNFSTGTVGKKTVTGQEVVCQFQPGGILGGALGAVGAVAGGAVGGYTGSQSSSVFALSADSCFEVALDCTNIKKCSDYNTIPVSYWDDDELQTEEIKDVLPNTLKGICVIDGCNTNGKDRCEYGELDKIAPCDTPGFF